MSLVARLARARLLHFAALGTLCFIAMRREAPPPAHGQRQIEVTPEVAATIRAREGLDPARPLPQTAVARWVEEEILFREGLRSNLHWNPAALARAEQMAAFLGEEPEGESADAPGWGDPVLRAQIVGKMRILLRREGYELEPSAAELAQHLAANATQYELPMGARFSHVFLDASVRGDGLVEDSRRVLAALRSSSARERSRALGSGDPFPIGDTDLVRSVSEIERSLGPEVARAVATGPIGEWTGAFRSPYGLHLVCIHDRTAARPAKLEEVHAAVELEWRKARADEIAARKLEGLRSLYDVAISAAVGGTAEPAE